MVKKKGTALLVVFADVDSEHDAEFNAWYNEEHIRRLSRSTSIGRCCRVAHPDRGVHGRRPRCSDTTLSSPPRLFH